MAIRASLPWSRMLKSVPHRKLINLLPGDDKRLTFPVVRRCRGFALPFWSSPLGSVGDEKRGLACPHHVHRGTSRAQQSDWPPSCLADVILPAQLPEPCLHDRSDCHQWAAAHHATIINSNHGEGIRLRKGRASTMWYLHMLCPTRTRMVLWSLSICAG